MSWLRASTAAALPLVLLAGCGSTTMRVTAPDVSLPQTTADSQPAPAPAAQPEPSQPTVDFTFHATGTQAGDWPFAARLDDIRTDVNGLPGSGADHARDQTLLVVQVAVTNLTPTQTPPNTFVGLAISCTGPHLGRLTIDTANSEYTKFGWDQGPDRSPVTLAGFAPPGDGQPHDWDIEWVVPDTLNAAAVKCRLLPEAPDEFSGGISITGSGALN
jgi:hypothetical protein